MKQHCTHCKVSSKIVKTDETPFGVLYHLDCKHQALVSKEIHEKKERQKMTLLEKFKHWVRRPEESEEEINPSPQ